MTTEAKTIATTNTSSQNVRRLHFQPNNSPEDFTIVIPVKEESNGAIVDIPDKAINFFNFLRDNVQLVEKSEKVYSYLESFKDKKTINFPDLKVTSLKIRKAAARLGLKIEAGNHFTANKLRSLGLSEEEIKRRLVG